MSELKMLARFESVHQADFFQSMLAEHGIKSYVNNATIVQMEWILSNAVGGVQLDCSDQDYEQAKAILNQFEFEKKQRRDRLREQSYEFDCEECGRKITVSADRCGFVESCPHCGKYTDVPPLPEDE